MNLLLAKIALFSLLAGTEARVLTSCKNEGDIALVFSGYDLYDPFYNDFCHDL